MPSKNSFTQIGSVDFIFCSWYILCQMVKSVSCVIFNRSKGSVLLIKRRDIPVWVLPGGGIEPGESPEAAALREAEEETGLKLTLARHIASYQPINRLTKPTNLYECEVIAGTPKTGSETREIGFFSLDNLPKRLVPFYKTWIDDALLDKKEELTKTIEKTSYFTFFHYLFTHPLLVFQFLLTRVGLHFNR